MKEIQLTKGYVAIVDDEDYYELVKYRWFAALRKHTVYAVRNICGGNYGKVILMHRHIMKPQDGEVIDHINCNGIDNRKSNLRICSLAQNNMNQRAQKNRTSQYKGVSLNRRLWKWEAYAQLNGNKKHLGFFLSELDAALAYDRFAIAIYGEFANINFPNMVNVSNNVE